jgi:hypothetical protein
MNKNILIIANLRHASPRIPEICKYFELYGWHPIIITPQFHKNQRERYLISKSNKIDIIETRNYYLKDTEHPYQSTCLNRLFQKHKIGWFLIKIFEKGLRLLGLAKRKFPDDEKFWTKFVLAEVGRIYHEKEISCILTSSSPVTCHILGSQIKEKYKTPWVADFRDLWSLNHNYPYDKKQQIKDKKLELKVLQNVDCITTVTPGLVNSLKTLHNKPIYCITNGFDEDIFNNIEKKKNDVFTIAYTGMIYKQKQNYKLFLEAISELYQEEEINQDMISVNFYGNGCSVIKKELDMNLQKFVHHYDSIPRSKILKIQKNADLLLFFNWEDKNPDYIPLPLKFLEYLGTGNVILAAGGFHESIVEDIICDTKTGYYSCTKEEIKSAVKENYDAFYGEVLQNNVIFNPVNEQIEKFGYKYLALQFVELFNSL